MAHLYIWPFVDEYDGAYVINIGIVREGLLQSTVIVQNPEYYIANNDNYNQVRS